MCHIFGGESYRLTVQGGELWNGISVVTTFHDQLNSVVIMWHVRYLEQAVS